MVYLYIQLHYLTAQPTAVNLDTVYDLLRYGAFKYTKTVLRHPDYVVLAMPQHMR